MQLIKSIRMLALEEVIIESNDDLEIWSSIVVGFDVAKSLVIRWDYIDYDEHEYDFRQDAVIYKDDAFKISCFLHTKLTDLPNFLFNEFGEPSNRFVPSEVEGLFKSILDFILDSGGHYILKRQKLRL